MNNILARIILIVAFLLIVIVGITACIAENHLENPIMPDNFADLRMEVISWTVEPTRANFIVHNPSNYRMIYGQAFAIEKWTGEVWESAELIAEASFLLIGYRLNAHETQIVTRHWDGLYGALTPGIYRLVKEFDEDNPNIPWEQRRSIVLSAPFEVMAE